MQQEYSNRMVFGKVQDSHREMLSLVSEVGAECVVMNNILIGSTCRPNVPKPSGSRLNSRRKNTPEHVQYRQMSFFPRTTPDLNSLPQKVVTAESLDCFKSRLNSFL